MPIASGLNDETQAVETILRLINETKTLPVGFIGSGFSRRYLGTPDWKGLLNYLASLTGEPLNRFLVSRPGSPQDTYPDTAAAIANTFREIWWNAEEYGEQRNIYAGRISDTADPLKLQAALYIANSQLTQEGGLKNELVAFGQARFQSFVTTNYDTPIEDHRPDYETYGSQSQALFSPMYEIGEIYKIHGTVADFSSLVLTRADYDEYAQQNPYLTAKMLTLFVENPVLFFGYSLGDPHVQKLLGALTQCLTEEQLSTLNQRLIFVGRATERRPPVLQQAPITVEGHTFYTYEVGLEDWGPLFAGMAEIPYHFAPRVLRRLRESVYLAASETETGPRFKVVDFDDDDDLNEVEIVLGVGVMDKIAATGYVQIGVARYIQDLLRGKTVLSAKSLADHTFRYFRPQYVPVEYVKRLADCQEASIDFSEHKQVNKWTSKSNSLQSIYEKGAQVDELKNFRNVLDADLKDYRKHDLALALTQWTIDDVVALRDYIEGRLTEDVVKTEILKLACLFDKLTYGGRYEGDLDALWGALKLDPCLRPR